MNKIKLKIISSIKNSRLDEMEKEKFSKLVEKISEKEALIIFFAIKKQSKDVDKIWKGIVDRLNLLGEINSFEFLSLGQSEALRKEILKLDLDTLEKIKEQKSVGKITIDDVKRMKMKAGEKYQEAKESLDEVLDKTRSVVNNFLAIKRKEKEADALDAIRNKLNSL